MNVYNGSSITCTPCLHNRFFLRRLRKPPLNPLSHDVRAGILEGLKLAQDDEAVSLIVITGGDKAFSAGADIKEMASAHAVRREPDLLTVVGAIEACTVPVVAAIGGVALGGGCEVRQGNTRVPRPGFSQGKLTLSHVPLPCACVRGVVGICCANVCKYAHHFALIEKPILRFCEVLFQTFKPSRFLTSPE